MLRLRAVRCGCREWLCRCAEYHGTKPGSGKWGGTSGDGVDYYAAAAEAGDAWGLFCLGQLVEEGEDLQYVDFLSDWFRRQDNAAEVDQSALAVMLHRRAAESGLAVAQFCLGMCYFCGHGVPKNMTLSAYWCRCSGWYRRCEYCCR